MSFSEAFARGYAVGDSIKKRRATAKFFEKFKELTDEGDDSELVAPDGTAIPASGEGAAPAAAAPATTEGNTAANDQQAALPVAPPAERGTPPQSAMPPAAAAVSTAASEPAANAEPVANAAQPPEQAIPTSPAAPTAGEAPAAKGSGKGSGPKKSLTQGDIKDLDRLALSAAQASGDASVYTALRQTTDSFLQGKVLKYLSLAQTASENNDVNATEKYLTKAYRFVPDGQEIKFTKKDGQLYMRDPWGDKPTDMIPLGSEQIGYIATMVTDPQKWSEVVRQERTTRQEQARRDRELAIAEQRTSIESGRAAEDVRHNKSVEGLQGREMTLKEQSQKYDNLVKVSQAGYYDAEAAAAGAKGTAAGAMKPDDMRQASEAAANGVRSFLVPTQDTLDGKLKGPVPKGYEMFVSPAGVDDNGRPTGGDLNKYGLRAQELAGGIAIANPELGVAAATSVGLEMARALIDPNGPKLAVHPNNNTITVPVGGRFVTVNVPRQTIEALYEAARVGGPGSQGRGNAKPSGK